ncbi:amino acid ABC transporter substrate-binding protein, PAAT family [Streptomyces zhaozhouensis]|uniref:Amino acid ABC transporter substrate-binding protein, PAAT family n=1 Tax=Streptomyces zhaozhouensis TaxID=1300267 RepID=A0A286E5W5_9ACTN|nr:glutamate ABC transporter substrate-binding protein [Streptomyces zhaozhouensis]SOD66295.1 amino acid ABC transporter substrate-binding protein, PAAT family [Streptomyces zhaozhouensis]
MRGTTRGDAGAGRGLAPHWRALLLGGAGLALAGAMVVGTLTAGSPQEGAGGREPTETADATRASLDEDPVPLASRERCDDSGEGGGFDPAESLSPVREVGPAVERIRERDQLVVGIDQNSYRWGYRHPDDGKIVGFDIDLARAIAEDLLGPDPDIVFRAIPTDQRIGALRTDKVDMVVRSMSITCERVEQVAFSASYFETGQQLLVPRGSPITGFDESMEGQRVCSAKETTAARLLERESHGAHLMERPNHLDCLVQIQLGLAEALMTDSALAAGHIGQDPTMRLVGEELTAESYGVAMRSEDEDLVRWVNAVLASYQAGGTSSRWRASFDEWLSGYLPDSAGVPPEPLYRD